VSERGGRSAATDPEHAEATATPAAAAERAEAPRRAAFEAPSGSHDAVLDPHNRRLKLYGLAPDDAGRLDPEAVIAGLGGDPARCTKVTVYARPEGAGTWRAAGWRNEGTIRGYFPDGADTVLWARYTDPERAVEARADEHRRTVELARSKEPAAPRLPQGYSSGPAAPEDAAEIGALMGAVFADYPSSLAPGHLARLIETGSSRFRWVRDGSGTMVAVASAEIDRARRNAEMTDCATLPRERGGGLMVWILRALERDLAREEGITDLYTLARADEIGMNCAFAKLGYAYTGCLVNNCRMPNGWESMNIWCRNARAADET
jgi:putative beta-lysine N-acetyltransferase